MRARTKLGVTFLFVLMLIAGVYGLWYWQLQQTIAKFSKPAPPISISAAQAKSQVWPQYISAIGTFSAVKGVDIHSETNGVINDIPFHSGQTVNKDDLLFQLNDTIDKAELKRQLANLRLTKMDYTRKSNLAKRNALEQSSVDAAKAAYDEAQAMVAKTQAMIDQKSIRAPFSGRIGIRNVSVGQYVTPTTALVSLQMLDPLHLDFSVPEQQLTKLTVGQEIEVSIDNDSHVYKGTLTAINAKVDPNSHNIQVQATVPNTEQPLVPGMFANVKIYLGKDDHVISVPETAITYSLYGDAIYIIRPEKNKAGISRLVVHRHFVVPGERRNHQVAIVQGLKKGDVVVSSGQLKLQDKAVVTINNSFEQGS